MRDLKSWEKILYAHLISGNVVVNYTQLKNPICIKKCSYTPCQLIEARCNVFAATHSSPMSVFVKWEVLFGLLNYSSAL